MLALHRARWKPGERALLPDGWREVVEVDPVMDLSVEPAPLI